MVPHARCTTIQHRIPEPCFSRNLISRLFPSWRRLECYDEKLAHTNTDQMIVSQTQNPMVVHVYHPYRQPDGINHCAAVNGHCSHLCLPAPQINSESPKISCACPNGLMLMSDGLMCAEEGKSLSVHTYYTSSVRTIMRHRLSDLFYFFFTMTNLFHLFILLFFIYFVLVDLI